LRERVVARALNANIETGPERHRSVTHEILLETWEQLDEGRLAAEQQRMHVPGLRRPPAIRGLRGQSVDIGYVKTVEPDDGELTATFNERLVTYGFGELDTLLPAYAATIHKSQGSEYPAVVIPVMTQHYTVLQRNLLYTGVTWGKRLVVVVGQKKGGCHCGPQCLRPAPVVETR
jgi:hypothetical protein